MKRFSCLSITACVVALLCGISSARINPLQQERLIPLSDATTTVTTTAAVDDRFFNDLHVGALWFPGLSNKGYIGFFVLSAFYPGGGDQSNLWEAGMWAGGNVEGRSNPWRYYGSSGRDSDPAQYDTIDEQAVVKTEDDLGLPYPYRRLTVHVNTADKPYVWSESDTLDGDLGMDVTHEWHQWGVPGYDHWVFVHVTIAFTKSIDDFWWGWMSDCDVGDVYTPDPYFDDYAGWDDTYKFCYMRDWDYDPLPGDTLWLSPDVIGQSLLAAPPINGPVTAPPDNAQRWASKNYWDWNNDVSSVKDCYDRLSGAWVNPFPPASPFDYRILNGVGPYSVSAGDTAHFWMAYVVGEGYDEDSHAMYGLGTLVDHVQEAHAFFDAGMVIPAVDTPPRAPDVDPDLIGDITGDELRVHWAPYNDIAGGASADSFIVYTSVLSKLGPWERVAAFDNTVTETQVHLIPDSCTYAWVQAYDTGNGIGSNPYALSSRLYQRDSGGIILADQTTIACVYSQVSPAIYIQSFQANALRSAVEIVWDIKADEKIKGFNLYRSEEKQEKTILVNTHGLIAPGENRYMDNEVMAGKTYEYVLSVVRTDGSAVQSRAVTVRFKAHHAVLHQNHPNPFNPTTTISFALPEKKHANLSVFSVNGKLVKTLVNDVVEEGIKEVTWDGTDARGSSVSSGVYFYRLKTGKQLLTRKMVLLK